MRHRRLRRKLGVRTKHRRALLRNLVRNLVIHKRIQTTYAKAKEASAFADHMVQLAKDGADLHVRRHLISELGSSKTAHTLIAEIAPKFKSRQGGYTRVLRLGFRPGDAADTALLEFTETFEAPKKAKKEKKDSSTKEKEPVKTVEKTAPAKVKEKEKEKEKKQAIEAEEKKKPASQKEDKEDKTDKKESEKKGGFLGALRKFLKGDEQ